MLVDLARNDLSIHGKIQRFPNWKKFIFSHVIHMVSKL
jgi:anthranilate/para-aminobenzoate synthase component I